MNPLNWIGSKQTEEYVVNDWLGGWTPAAVPDLTGKTALITGGNSGIGFETARKLAENGAHVLLVSRDAKNGQEAAMNIRNELGKKARVDVLQCDMSSLKNVQSLAREVRNMTSKLDMLILNAGLFHPGPFAWTQDGIEQTMHVNYFAHALLTLMLLDTLRDTPGSRVIFMSSPAEAFGRLDWTNLTGSKYKDSGMTPYGTSKMYLMMLSKELADRVPNVKFFCVQPGLVSTPLQHKASWRYWTAAVITTASAVVGQTQRRGAYSTIYAATSPDLEGDHWGYWGPNAFNLWPTTRREAASLPVYNPASCWKLFESTVDILRAKLGPGADLPRVPHPDDVHGARELQTQAVPHGANMKPAAAPRSNATRPAPATTRPVQA